MAKVYSAVRTIEHARDRTVRDPEKWALELVWKEIEGARLKTRGRPVRGRVTVQGSLSDLVEYVRRVAWVSPQTNIGTMFSYLNTIALDDDALSKLEADLGSDWTKITYRDAVARLKELGESGSFDSLVRELC